MAGQHHHQDKVKVVIDCSVEERAYIKMLAAHKHMTISEYFLSFAKGELAEKSRIPNKETLASMKELDEGGGTEYTSMDAFWADIGVDRRAKH